MENCQPELSTRRWPVWSPRMFQLSVDKTRANKCIHEHQKSLKLSLNMETKLRRETAFIVSLETVFRNCQRQLTTVTSTIMYIVVILIIYIYFYRFLFSHPGTRINR